MPFVLTLQQPSHLLFHGPCLVIHCLVIQAVFGCHDQQCGHKIFIALRFILHGFLHRILQLHHFSRRPSISASCLQALPCKSVSVKSTLHGFTFHGLVVCPSLCLLLPFAWSSPLQLHYCFAALLRLAWRSSGAFTLQCTSASKATRRIATLYCTHYTTYRNGRKGSFAYQSMEVHLELWA